MPNNNNSISSPSCQLVNSKMNGLPIGLASIVTPSGKLKYIITVTHMQLQWHIFNIYVHICNYSDIYVTTVPEVPTLATCLHTKAATNPDGSSWPSSSCCLSPEGLATVESSSSNAEKVWPRERISRLHILISAVLLSSPCNFDACKLCTRQSLAVKPCLKSDSSRAWIMQGVDMKHQITWPDQVVQIIAAASVGINNASLQGANSPFTHTQSSNS